MAEKTFAEGIYYEAPSDKAPAWVKGKLSFKVADAVKFLQANENNAGYCNVDILEGKSGKVYTALNDYKPEKPEAFKDDGSSSVPF